MNPNDTDSSGWIMFSYIIFGLSILMMGFGIYRLEADSWVKSYFMMSSLLLVAGSLIFAKTSRDRFESGKLLQKIEKAKTEKMLKSFDAVA